MDEENISVEFRLKNIDETRNYLNWWVRGTKKFVQLWFTLNINLFEILQLLDVFPFLILLFLVGIHTGIMKSDLGLKFAQYLQELKHISQ